MGNRVLRECTAENLAMSHRQLKEEEEAQEEADAALAEMQRRLAERGGANIVRSPSGTSVGSVEDLLQAAGAPEPEAGSLVTLSTTASNDTNPLAADVTVESPPPPPPASSPPPLNDPSQADGD